MKQNSKTMGENPSGFLCLGGPIDGDYVYRLDPTFRVAVRLDLWGAHSQEDSATVNTENVLYRREEVTLSEPGAAPIVLYLAEGIYLADAFRMLVRNYKPRLIGSLCPLEAR